MPYSYDDETIREVRESTDIVEIISEYVDLKRAGENYKGLCPFHSEKTPSMVVSSEKQFFHCFGCGEGGDVISFLVKHRNMEFKEVIVELAERANIELKQKTSQDIEREKARQILYELNREAAILFYKNLAKNQKALKYLFSRGIGKDAIKRFGIGFSIDSWDQLLNHLKSKGYSESDIEKAGLAVKHRERNSYYDRFRDRIIFPIWDVNSRVIGFGGRLLSEVKNQPKYLNSPDTEIFSKGRNLYGLNLVKDGLREKRVVLVEGYMDVISLYQNGIANSVASLGTALTSEQVKLLKRYTNDLVIAYDADEAGINATKKAIETIKRENIIPKIIELENGLDPDDFIKKYGSERFKFKVENAHHYIDFLININKKKYDLNVIEDKLKFIKEMSSWLETVKSPVEFELYINKVAAETGVKSEAIKSEIVSRKKNLVKKESFPKKKSASVPSLEIKTNSAKQMEIELIYLLIDKSIKLDEIEVDLSVEDFEDSLNKRIVEKLSGQNRIVSLEKHIEDESDEEIKERLIEISSLKLNLADDLKEKAILDYAKKIKVQKLKARKKRIMDEIIKIESDAANKECSTQEFIDLCRELTEIERDIKRY